MNTPIVHARVRPRGLGDEKMKAAYIGLAEACDAMAAAEVLLLRDEKIWRGTTQV